MNKNMFFTRFRTVIFVLMCMVLLSISLPYIAIAATVGVGQINYVRGNVWILKQGGERSDAAKGTMLQAADVIMTDDSGRAKLKMIDESMIYVGRSSRLAIKKYDMDGADLSDASLDMLWGRARFAVNKLRANGKFKVRTKTAVLGVRGTGWAMIVPLPRAISGQVNMNNAQLVYLGDNINLNNISSEAVRVVMLTGKVEATTNTGVSVSMTAGSTTDLFPSGKVKQRDSSRNDMETEIKEDKPAPKEGSSKKSEQDSSGQDSSGQSSSGQDSGGQSSSASAAPPPQSPAMQPMTPPPPPPPVMQQMTPPPPPPVNVQNVTQTLRDKTKITITPTFVLP
ncbi:MAG: FecR family protein [Mariprofundales bacterium]